MEFSVLNSKKKDSTNKIDLASNVLKINYDQVIIKDYIKIDESALMSLDLVSYAMYGTEDHVDVIMKFNRLRNPLAIPIGTILAIPELESFRANSELINIKPIQLQRKKQLNSSSSAPNQNIPSVATSGTSAIKKKNGILIF